MTCLYCGYTGGITSNGSCKACGKNWFEDVMFRLNQLITALDNAKPKESLEKRAWEVHLWSDGSCTLGNFPLFGKNVTLIETVKVYEH